MTKKNFLFALAMMAIVPLQQIHADPITLNFQVAYEEHGNNGGRHRTPVLVPTISIEDYTLYFWDDADFTISIVDDDEQIVYTTFVPAGQISVTLPLTLSGTYTIEVNRGGQTFEGEITL